MKSYPGTEDVPDYDRMSRSELQWRAERWDEIQRNLRSSAAQPVEFRQLWAMLKPWLAGSFQKRSKT